MNSRRSNGLVLCLVASLVALTLISWYGADWLRSQYFRYRFWRAATDNERLDQLRNLYVLDKVDWTREAIHLIRWGRGDIRKSPALWLGARAGLATSGPHVRVAYDTDGDGHCDLTIHIDRTLSTQQTFTLQLSRDADGLPFSFSTSVHEAYPLDRPRSPK